MGGGTGTGGAPVVASLAREMGILTVGIVTIPFLFEGRKRKQQADNGIEELRRNVDTLLVICNDKLRELYGDLTLSRAFGKADDILTVAAKGIAEIITVPGYINVDFEDINTVMRDSGVAIMGSGSAEGPDRATKAIKEALESPLLNDNDIYGAENILLYITSGEEEVSMDEVSEITDYIQKEAGMEADIIWGNGTDENLGMRLNITLVATGFDKKERKRKQAEPEKVVVGALGETPAPAPYVEPEPATQTMEVAEEEVRMVLPQAPAVTMHTLTEEEPPVFQDITSQPDYMPLIPEEQESEIELLLRDTSRPAVERQESWARQEVTGVSEVEKVHEEIRRVVTPEARTSREEQAAEPGRNGNEGRAMDRVKRLKEMSLKLRSFNDINELERQPAYVRRNVDLTDPPHSSESQISRFSLSENGGDRNGSELRQNNSFLHDNVD